MMRRLRKPTFAGMVWLLVSGPSIAQTSFVNFETPHVHPIDLSSDGNTLAVVNTADNRIEVFSVTTGLPVHLRSISTGLDPVTVRFQNTRVAWVVNHVSDTVTVVDTRSGRTMTTVATLDEPTDVVFAGTPQRAYVSCSQADTVQVFDPGDLRAPPIEIPVAGEDPRALAVSIDGQTVYAAIFESGNSTTVLAGGYDVDDVLTTPSLARNVVSDPEGPYSGANPPPNRGDRFEPPITPGLEISPPPVALIVKKDDGGRWLDDNGGDWTSWVTGPMAPRTRRPVGWDVLDNDVAVIDTRDNSVRYVERAMNLCMALAVHPVTGEVTVVGTDATNEVRFEPNLRGTFVRARFARARTGRKPSLRDLNPHLDYTRATVAQAVRDQSIGDPRAIVWQPDGRRGYVAGMGSNNVIVIDAQGRRVGESSIIPVGEGPTGLVLDRFLDRLYVLNRFDASISVVDTVRGVEVERVRFFDPTPLEIRRGRKFLYDTHLTSGLGQASCASCHVDARMDRLAWDLGQPDGRMKSQRQSNILPLPGDNVQAWHPMKGPMTTQTFQDIIGKEPFHWRGDRDGLEEFNEAFVALLGDEDRLTRAQMRQFELFLASIHFPPNPFRDFDNSLPADLPLPGHFSVGRIAEAGAALPNGNARSGLQVFRDAGRNTRGLVRSCVECHTLTTGAGTPRGRDFQNGTFPFIPPGPNGEEHLRMIPDDFAEQLGFKIPHLRNLYDKVGMETTRRISRSGFGFSHDGSIDSLARFVSAEVFEVRSEQEVADMVAFMLAFSGGDLPRSSAEPPGAPSRDAHAAVGRQATIGGPRQQRDLIEAMLALADAGAVDVIVKGFRGGRERGWLYRPELGRFQADKAGDPSPPLDRLVLRATPRTKLTFTVVPSGTGVRMAVDRDEDGVLDSDDPVTDRR